jgi:histidine triad (HIT) family protein
MDCIFCKIIEGEIPSEKIYEDEKTFAFMDINPLNEGHVLIIPKTHAATVDTIEESDFLAVMATTHKLAAAVKKALQPDGMNLLQLNGKAANQMVPHLHVHIVPRWSGDGLTVSKWEIVPGDPEKIKKTATQIRDSLS